MTRFYARARVCVCLCVCVCVRACVCENYSLLVTRVSKFDV